MNALLSAPKRALAALLCASIAGGSLISAPAMAQELGPGAVADVVGVAGEDFYLSIGAEAGLRTGMVLEVRVEGEDGLLGRIRIIQAGSDRSAATFDGEPFPVTRGTRLALRVAEPGAESVRDTIPPRGPRAAAGPARRTDARRPPGPEVHGSLGVSFDARRSVIEWEDAGLSKTERTFTTPASWLNMTASGLPGGFRFRLVARATHRGSSDDLIDPAGLVRVSSVQLTNSYGIVDLGLGRTYNPRDASSGYFDGAYLRAGRAFGVGLIAGFEPERGNAALSTDLPKLSAFADYSHAGAAFGYRGVASVTALRPTSETSRVDRTTVGLRQTIRVKRLRLGQSLLVDRGQASGDWAVSRLLLDASVRLGDGLSLRGRYAHRKPVNDLAATEEDFQPYTRDLGSIGLGYAASGGFAAVDVGFHDADSEDSAGLTLSGSAGLRPGSGFGADVSAGYWEGGERSTFSVRPGLSRRVGAATARAWYSLYRTDEPEAEQTTHTAGASVEGPLAERLRGRLSGRLQAGSILSGSGLSASISWLF